MPASAAMPQLSQHHCVRKETAFCPAHRKLQLGLAGSCLDSHYTRGPRISGRPRRILKGYNLRLAEVGCQSVSEVRQRDRQTVLDQSAAMLFRAHLHHRSHCAEACGIAGDQCQIPVLDFYSQRALTLPGGTSFIRWPAPYPPP